MNWSCSHSLEAFNLARGNSASVCVNWNYDALLLHRPVWQYFNDGTLPLLLVNFTFEWVGNSCT